LAKLRAAERVCLGSEEKRGSAYQLLLRNASQRTPSLSGGLRLGLFIVKQIVSAHGGTVTVTSSRENGTNFTVRLPRQPDSDAAQRVADA